MRKLVCVLAALSCVAAMASAADARQIDPGWATAASGNTETTTTIDAIAALT